VSACFVFCLCVRYGGVNLIFNDRRLECRARLTGGPRRRARRLRNGGILRYIERCMICDEVVFMRRCDSLLRLCQGTEREVTCLCRDSHCCRAVKTHATTLGERSLQRAVNGRRRFKLCAITSARACPTPFSCGTHDVLWQRCFGCTLLERWSGRDNAACCAHGNNTGTRLLM
jgi:hypothetical protein